MLNESEIGMFKLLAIIFAIMLAVTLLMRWWDGSGKKSLTRWLSIRGWVQEDPAKAALNRLKRDSICCAIALLFLALFRLPVIIHVITLEQAKSPEELIQFQKDLDRMREVIYIGLMINMFWLWAVYKALKEIVIKKSNHELPENASDNRIAPFPRNEF